MTNKQIIIDGVDVSGCEFLIMDKDKQMCHCLKSSLFGMIEFVENAKNKNCKDNPNCYYKQLKRKEQECETLASQLDFEVQKKECLEQECEGLKRQHQADKGLITSTGKMNYQLIQEYDKLKNCLTEIKVLSENVYCLTNALNRDMALFAKEILQKISEVEDV